MGSGVAFAIYFGKKDMEQLKSGIFISFVFIAVITLVLNVLLIPEVKGAAAATVFSQFVSAAVKIDSFAYMPVQDFGNAFSTFIAQNYGAGKKDRIRKGICTAAGTGFSLILTVISLGTRVALAYVLAGVSTIGVTGIWLAIPIGWVLADMVGAAGLWIGCRRDI